MWINWLSISFTVSKKEDWFSICLIHSLAQSNFNPNLKPVLPGAQNLPENLMGSYGKAGDKHLFRKKLHIWRQSKFGASAADYWAAVAKIHRCSVSHKYTVRAGITLHYTQGVVIESHSCFVPLFRHFHPLITPGGECTGQWLFLLRKPNHTSKNMKVTEPDKAWEFGSK